MKIRSIFFYGDSNTWGFDPRTGDRYPENVRWTGRLAEQFSGKYLLKTDGLNGRRVPDVLSVRTRSYLTETFRRAAPFDLFTVMLGTNDLLWPMHPDPEETAREMASFLTFAQSLQPESRILLLAPPVPDGIVDTTPIFRRLALSYRELAGKKDYLFADTAGWGIETAFDGVHFSEEGHARFAARLAALLSSWI